MKPPRLERNGRYWRAVWHDHHGKRCRHSLGAGTKDDAQEALGCWLENGGWKMHHLLMPGPPTLRIWLSQYLGQHPEMSEKTAALYQQAVNHWLHHNEDAALNKVRPDQCHAFAGLLKDRVKATTASKHLRNLKILFRAAVDQELIKDNPFATVKTAEPQSDQEQVYVSRETMDVLFPQLHPEDRRLLGLARFCGLRAGEIARAKWEDVDEDSIEVAHEGVRGTKQKARMVPISAVAFEWIDTPHANNNADPIVPWSPTPDRVKAMIARCGVKPWPKPLHSLRKSCESDWLAEFPVSDVCKWMGHSPQVAARYYHQTTPDVWARATGTK